MTKSILIKGLRIILSMGLILSCSVISVAAKHIYYIEYEVKTDEATIRTSNKPPLSDKEIIKSWYKKDMARIDSGDSSTYVSLDKGCIYSYSPLEKTYWELSLEAVEEVVQDVEKEMKRITNLMAESIQSKELEAEGDKKKAEKIKSECNNIMGFLKNWIGNESDKDVAFYRTGETRKIGKRHCYEAWLKGPMINQHLWITTDIKFSEDYFTIMSYLPNNPNKLAQKYQKEFKGIPVRIDSTFKSSLAEKSEIKTTAILTQFKKIKYTPAIFDKPKGFKRTDDPFTSITRMLVVINTLIETRVRVDASMETLTRSNKGKENDDTYYQKFLANRTHKSGRSCLASKNNPHKSCPKISADIPVVVRKEIIRLRDADPDIRIEAAYTLGNMGEEAIEAVPFLLTLIKNRPHVVYKRRRMSPRTPEQEAIKALREMGKPGLNAVILLLKAQDRDQRKKAVSALGGMGQIDDSVVIPALAAVIKGDENWKVRQLAIVSLTNLGFHDPLVVSTLVKAIREEPLGFVRAEAIRMLGKMDTEDEEIIGVLKSCLRADKDNEARKAAVRFLAKWMGTDKKVIDSLITALKTDSAGAVRAEAAAVLGTQLRIPRGLYNRYGKFFVQGKSQKASQANSSSILDSEYKRVGKALRSAILIDQDRSVQNKAITALGKIREYDDETVDTLLHVLSKSPYSDLRGNAAQALWFMGRNNDKVIKALLTSLKQDRVEEVRLKAVSALAIVGRDNKQAQEVLRSVLKNTTSVELEIGIQNALGIRRSDGPSHRRSANALASKHKIPTAQEKKNLLQGRLERMIRSYLPGLRQLLRDEFQNDSSHQGTMTISFQISVAGDLTQAAVVSCSSGLVPLKGSILDQVRLWKFPLIGKNYGEVDITYSFVFQKIQDMGKPAYKTMKLVAHQR